MRKESNAEKEMQLNEREAVLLKREQMLEQRIREILRREQMVAVKEERIEDLLHQLQSQGLHEVAAGLEDSFEEAIADLERNRQSRRRIIQEAESMSDGGSDGSGLWGKSMEKRAAHDQELMMDLLDEPGLEPGERSRRFLERLDRELDSRARNDVWDRADRMRYLATTFKDAGNHSKSAEYSRRALIILGEFS